NIRLKIYFVYQTSPLQKVKNRRAQSGKLADARKKETKQTPEKTKEGKFAMKHSRHRSGTPHYQEEFGHLEDRAIVDRHHKSAIITLIERQTKCIIAIKPRGKQAADIKSSLRQKRGQ